MRAWGATEAQIREAVGDPADNCFAVWATNRPALELFLSLGTQWRTGPLGGVLGLDYPAAEAVMRMLRVKDQAVALSDLRVMETAALVVLNTKE